MVWIKRNLVFVISAVVGLLLTGFCGYLLSTSLSANNGVSEEYKTTLSSLQELQQKSPQPSTENIQAAKADQARVKAFLDDFRKVFVPFPVPPHEDEQGFKTYLEQSLASFQAEATNAGVTLPPGYDFAFSGQVGKLTYAAESIGPWMQQLEEIKIIMGILYQSKINYLEGVQRVPVSTDDVGGTGADYLAATTTTNPWGTETPYRVKFRGFSTEVAAVLDGFARSSNCFIVKDVEVTPSKADLPMVIQQASSPQMIYMPAPQNNPYNNPYGGERRQRGFREGRPMPPPQQQMVVVAPSAPAKPLTILSENPLYVTIVVEVVKLKVPEH